MFDEVLIESAGKERHTGTWITALISGVIHTVIIGAIVATGVYVNDNPGRIEKPMAAFIAVSAPPPPPPPPPASGGPTQARAEVARPREQQRDPLTPPRDMPRDVPHDLPEVAAGDSDHREHDGGVPGGVPGGQRGGIVGGQVGGEDGGVLDGKVGGQRGGPVGGTGDQPLPVGGNVKAPIAVTRVEPLYTEIARRVRVQGTVIIQAVIDRHGNVTEARVLKPLPFGLDDAALAAVKQWKFQPGTLNGQPVPVYYNLTVNFRIE